MREAVKRAFIVLWVGWVMLGAYALKTMGIFDHEAWQAIGWSSMALWALQFIATGIGSPLTLIETTEFRQK